MSTGTDLRDPSHSLVAKMIGWSVANRIFVLLGALALFSAGMMAVRQIPLDAIPDLSDTQVIVHTAWPGQAPQIIEDQVTYPLSAQMISLPKSKVVRGFSMFGDSFVYIIFEEGVDMYWARSRVLEALSQVDMPEGVRTQLGPDATGVGWVFQYALIDRSGRHDLQALRSLQNWFIRYELATVDGVAEIASVGGFVKEYQVLVRPHALHAYGISLGRVIEAVRGANRETGGRTLEIAETEYMIRSLGYVGSPEDLKKVVLKAGDNGNPVTIEDVARVVEGPAIRRGIVALGGEGEAVGGIVVMRPGANAHNVISDIKSRLVSIRQGLPDGVELVTVYDRSRLIEGSVSYLKHKLFEESLMVALVAFLFLLHVRSAFVAIITLPLGIMTAFAIMAAQGITVNIMSLGGIVIAIGTMVDASIVMVENAHRKLAQADQKDRREIIIEAAKEVGPGLFFSLLIIAVSFLPVFALTGQSYRLFAPLAFTKTYAMAAAAFLSVTLVPVLMLWLIKGKIRREEQNPFNRLFMALYRPVLDGALKYRMTTLVIALIALASTAIPVSRIGSEFMPSLYEGGLLYMPMTLPGVSPAKAREILQVTNRQIMSVPEVMLAFGKAGRADTATDPAPLAMVETWIELKPRNEWRSGMTPEKLIAELDKKVRLPGMRNVWGYPIKIRMEMLTTGIRTPVGIKIAGPDLEGIDALARQIEVLARTVPGTRSAIADRVQGGKYIEIVPDREKISRYGIDLATVQTVIQTALGGVMLDEAIEGRARYPIILRYDRPYRERIGDLENVLVSAPSGAQIPLANLAEIRTAEGPAMITSEDARLNGWVFVDIKDRDLGSYIDNLQAVLRTVELPPGYSLKIAGQFEQLQQARARLNIAIPATVLIITILLYMYFGHWDRTLMILLAVPFGMVGGFWWVWLAGCNMSVAVAVGFIALAGIAVETAMVMLIYIDHRMRERWPETIEQLTDNVRHGALLRLRPKLMTASTIILGLIPIFLTDGPGADVMRRIALPMVGGMISTIILTLILIPVVYTFYMQRKLKL